MEPRLKDKGSCECGTESCTQYGTFRKDRRCVKTCTACPKCRGGNNRLSGLRSQRKESKALAVAQKNSLGYGNEETAGIELDWEHKSGAQARPVFTAFNKAAEQIRARKAVGRLQRPELVTFSMDSEPYTLKVYRSDQELDYVYARARALGLL